jgi:hypothetical protein
MQMKTIRILCRTPVCVYKDTEAIERRSVSLRRGHLSDIALPRFECNALVVAEVARDPCLSSPCTRHVLLTKVRTP